MSTNKHWNPTKCNRANENQGNAVEIIYNNSSRWGRRLPLGKTFAAGEDVYRWGRRLPLGTTFAAGEGGLISSL